MVIKLQGIGTSRPVKVTDNLQTDLLFARSLAGRVKIRVRTLRESLAEYSKRGDLKAIHNNLLRASQDGKLKQGFMQDFLHTYARNLNMKKQGRRFMSSQKLFYEVLSYIGGPRVVSYVAANFSGPDIHSLYLWRQKEKIQVTGRLTEDNFMALASMYKNHTDKTGRVPVLRSEDETAIISKITYHQDGDVLRGFCGVDGDNHQCLDEFDVPANDYNAIHEAFNTCRKGSYGRAVLLNPLHPMLPKVAVVLHPSCNKFDHMFVLRQWQKLDKLYEDHLEPVLGPLIGGSSDGDSRRRKLMTQMALSTRTHKYYPIPREEGFIFTANKETVSATQYVIRNIPDQDFIHNIKKLINILLHARTIMVGQFFSSLNQLRQVRDTFPVADHHLTNLDLTRDDRQNYRSCEKVCRNDVRSCLLQLINGRANPPLRPQEDLKGLYVYLTIVSKYIEIFLNPTRRLEDRVEYAATVVIFLAVWHNFIAKTPNVTLTDNFITRESYTDVLLSCHSAVSTIGFMGDNFPDQDCHLDQMGTDCVETFWSKMGQWVGNHHNYTYGDLYRNYRHMVRMEEIRLDPNAPTYARPHPKKESTWHLQYRGTPNADLTDYPTPQRMIQCWRAGKLEAFRLARYVGMFPSDNEDDTWFYRPFDDPSNRFFTGLDDDMFDDQGGCGDGGEDDDGGDNDDGGDDDGGNNDDGGDDDVGGDNDDDQARRRYCDEDNSPSNVLVVGSGHDTDDGHAGEEGAHGVSASHNECASHDDDGLDGIDSPLGEDDSESDEQAMAGIREILDQDIPELDGDPVRPKSVPVVDLPSGSKMYKSTLVALLNDDPKLSHSRLSRVRERQEYDTRRGNGSYDRDGKVCLYENYAYVAKQEVMVGKVVRMVLNGSHGRKDYVLPVPLDDQKKEQIVVVFKQYSSTSDLLCQFKDSQTYTKVPLAAVLTHVNLIWDGSLYSISAEESQLLQEEKGRLACRNVFVRSRRNDQAAVFDGVIRCTVQPQAAPAGLRRSCRARTVIENLD